TPSQEPEPVTNWFGANTGPTQIVTEAVSIPEPIEIVRQEEPVVERRESGFFGRKRESKSFDDGFDLPEFLK
ncbi:MAG: hypothetical protein EBR26_05660, partial [Microbacteriaceae bacterium]|nr:hypothetical protein [Microbacteriaceae bacterium]